MIKVKYQDRIYFLKKEKMKVRDILKELNLNQSYVIVLKNNEMATEDEVIRGDEEIEIISAISGG